MVHAADVLSTDNELFRIYLYYSCILVLKIFAVVPLIGIQRYSRNVFANPEDANFLGVKPRIDENVERVRRAHLNDLENIPVFFVVSFAYILTNPAVGTKTMLFKIFTAARILHTLVYAVWVTPQPARFLAFIIGMVVVTNIEDANFVGVKPSIDEHVERMRRAHLNDLESIPVFLIVSFAYILTNPALETTTMLFRIFTVARYLHTLVYAVWVVPQPARAISFEVGFMITIYMTVKSIFYFM